MKKGFARKTQVQAGLDLSTGEARHLQAGVEQVQALVLFPFSTAALSRSLAACRLAPVFREEGPDDLQASAASTLVGFHDQVPWWALEACAVAGSGTCLVVVRLPREVCKDAQGRVEPGPVLPTSCIEFIAFRDEATREDYLARLEQFPDVPINRFATRVWPDAFGTIDHDRPPGIPSTTSARRRTEMAKQEEMSRVGGVIAALRGMLALDRKSDVFVERGLFGKRGRQLRHALYEAASEGLEPGPVDRLVWDEAWSVVESTSAKQGLDVFGFLDGLAGKLAAKLGPADRQSFETWRTFSREILEGQRDFPKSFEDSANNALRAVLIFLVAKDYASLVDMQSGTTIGPRVRVLAAALLGLFERLDRLPVSLKGVSRSHLDSLSEASLVRASGNPICLQFSPATLGGDSSLLDEVTFNGRAFLERSFPVEPDLKELFAKARRHNLEAAFENETQRFFFDMGGCGWPARAEGNRLYVEIVTTTTVSRAARFYCPLVKVGASGLAKKHCDYLLEQAWVHNMGIGRMQQGRQAWVCYFWLHLLDTFDHDEFSAMLSRFSAAPRLVPPGD